VDTDRRYCHRISNGHRHFCLFQVASDLSRGSFPDLGLMKVGQMSGKKAAARAGVSLERHGRWSCYCSGSQAPWPLYAGHLPYPPLCECP